MEKVHEKDVLDFVKEQGNKETLRFITCGSVDDGKSTLIGRLPVSYTHLRAHETVLDLVCRLLLEKKKNI